MDIVTATSSTYVHQLRVSWEKDISTINGEISLTNCILSTKPPGKDISKIWFLLPKSNLSEKYGIGETKALFMKSLSCLSEFYMNTKNLDFNENKGILSSDSFQK